MDVSKRAASLLVILGVACNGRNDADENVAAVSQAVAVSSNKQVPSWSLSINLPTWGNLGVLAQAITGTQTVSVGAGAVLLPAQGGGRRSIIAAGGPVTIQADARVVGVVATGTVEIGDRADVTGPIQAPLTRRGSAPPVVGPSPQPGTAVGWNISTPAGIVTSWELQPGQEQSLSPGRSGDVVVKRDAKLVLSVPGRYFLESLDLESGSTLELTSTTGPTEVYVRQGELRLRGAIKGSSNVAESLALIYAGTSNVVVESELAGALIAPLAQVSLRATATPHQGAVFAKGVALDAHATFAPVAQPFLVSMGGLTPEQCSWSIPPKSTGNRRQDEFNYQYEILRYCLMPNASDDVLRLTGQANYEFAEGSAQMSAGNIEPGQLIGFVQRRAEQLAAARKDAALAREITQGPDGDQDWVVDSRDQCTNTPFWTPVDANGCPLPLRPGPDGAKVRDFLSRLAFTQNPKCDESALSMQLVNLAVAVYMAPSPEEGAYVYIQDMPGQPVGCEPWYVIEAKPVKNGKVLDYIRAFFPYSAASHTGRVVPTVPPPFLQLHADPNAPKGVGRLGKLAKAFADGDVDEVVFRAQAVSALGAQGPWSQWSTFRANDCRAVGFKCW